MPSFQQSVFGFGVPGAPLANVASILPPNIQAGVPTPLGMPPRFPLPFPIPPTPLQPIGSHAMTPSMYEGFPISMPSLGHTRPPLVGHSTLPSSHFPLPTPSPPGSAINTTVCHFSVSQTLQPVRQAPPPPNSKLNSPNSSSTGPSATSSVIFESDPSQTSDSDSAAHSDSSVGIDLNNSVQNSSSLSGSNPNAPPFYPRKYPQTPSSVSQSAKIVDLEESQTRATSPRKGEIAFVALF